MATTPLKRGYIPASTPIQPLNDSGYFGSCNRSPFAKVVHALSPIKECSPLKKKLNNLVEFAKDVSFKRSIFFGSCTKSKSSDPKVTFSTDSHVKSDSRNTSDSLVESPAPYCRRLNFNDSSLLFSSFNCDLANDRVLHLKPAKAEVSKGPDLNNNSPVVELSSVVKVPAEETYRKEKVDFLKELSNMNCFQTISSILSHVPARDICKMSMVSKTWKQVVSEDKKANGRRKKYLKAKHSCKENRDISKRENLEESKNPFCNITNDVVFKQPLTVKGGSMFDSFLKEAKKLEKGSLVKCPRCKHAARSLSGNVFRCTACDYVFCKECLSPFFQGHSCPVLIFTEPVVLPVQIGSKKSKKNLKRL